MGIDTIISIFGGLWSLITSFINPMYIVVAVIAFGLGCAYVWNGMKNNPTLIQEQAGFFKTFGTTAKMWWNRMKGMLGKKKE